MAAEKNALSYEEAMTKLEEIVTQLENGSLSLEDALKLFEEGTGLANACHKMLDEAEQKITQINQSFKDEASL